MSASDARAASGRLILIDGLLIDATTPQLVGNRVHCPTRKATLAQVQRFARCEVSHAIGRLSTQGTGSSRRHGLPPHTFDPACAR